MDAQTAGLLPITIREEPKSVDPEKRFNNPHQESTLRPMTSDPTALLKAVGAALEEAKGLLNKCLGPGLDEARTGVAIQ